MNAEQFDKLLEAAQAEGHRKRLKEQLDKLKSQAHDEQQCVSAEAHLAHVWPEDDVICFCPGLWSHRMVIERYFECESNGWTGEYNYHDWRQEALKRYQL